MASRPVVKKVVNDYSSSVRLVMMEVPHESRQSARRAALAALAAHEQGKYWEMHDLLFERWQMYDDENLIKNAQQLGLDIERFKQSMASKATNDIIDRNLKIAGDFHVFMTPTFIINDRKYDGEMSERELKKIIDRELSKSKK